MKQSTLLLSVFALLAIAAVNSAQGQATLVNAPDTVYMAIDTMGTSPAEVHWDVVNETDASMALMVSRFFVDTVSPFNYPFGTDGNTPPMPLPGSYERFCWGPTCFNYGQDSSPTNEAFLVSLDPGQGTDTFRGDFYPNGVEGESTLRYCFIDLAGDSAEVCHDVTFVATATASLGREAVRADNPSFTIAPNPTRDVVQVRLQEARQGTLELRNLVGQVVASWPVNPSTTRLQLPIQAGEGLWLMTYSVEGRVVSTQRLVVH